MSFQTQLENLKDDLKQILYKCLNVEQKLEVFDNKEIIEKLELLSREINQKFKVFGKHETQVTRGLFTLGEFYHPLLRLRQCLAQIEDRRKALRNTLQALQQKIEESQQLSEEDLELVVYIEAALKELAYFIKAYHSIKKEYNIPDDWDEIDFEEAMIEEYIAKAITKLLNEVQSTGLPSETTIDMLRKLGIEPYLAIHDIKEYADLLKQMLESGKVPRPSFFHQFLNEMVARYKPFVREKFKLIGIPPYFQDLCFKEKSKWQKSQVSDQLTSENSIQETKSTGKALLQK